MLLPKLQKAKTCVSAIYE